MTVQDENVLNELVAAGYSLDSLVPKQIRGAPQIPLGPWRPGDAPRMEEVSCFKEFAAVLPRSEYSNALSRYD